MAQNKTKTLKILETTSMWCAIASILVFFGNLIAFVAILVIGGTKASGDYWESNIRRLTIVTEVLSLVLILAWIVMAIIEMVMIRKNQELKKYHPGTFASWIVAIVLSLGFLFLSLLIFLKYGSEWTIYVTFILYLAATSGSIIYTVSVSRSLRRINGK